MSIYDDCHLCKVSIILSVANEPIMLNVIMLNVIILGIVMLSVVAQIKVACFAKKYVLSKAAALNYSVQGGQPY